MSKILILGSPGAGKTWLAYQLAEKCSLPIIHLDRLYWKDKWEPLPLEKKQQITQDLLKKSSWIMEGNYIATLEERAKAADTIIFLDINRWICLTRVLWRIIKFWRCERPELEGTNCKERLDWKLLTYLWNYPLKDRPRIKHIIDTHKANIFILSNHNEIKNFIKNN